MLRFNYRARDAQGQLVQGTVEANDRAGAILAVEQRRCVPIKIEAAAGQTVSATTGNFPGGLTPAMAGGKAVTSKVPAPLASAHKAASISISHSQRLFFTEQLAYLLSVGMTLDEALGVLVKRLKQPGLQRLTATLHRRLVDGQSFSQALREYPKIFPPLYVNLVMAGEASGALSDILTRLVKHLTSMKVLRDRVMQALIYPAFLVLAGVGLIIIFITVMVPQLKTFFSSTSGGTLPLPTRMLIGANELIVQYWWVMVAAGGLIFAAFKTLTRSPAGADEMGPFPASCSRVRCSVELPVLRAICPDDGYPASKRRDAPAHHGIA